MQLSTDRRLEPGRAGLHDAVVEAVRLITPKELCFRLGITEQYLSEALYGKNRKGFRTDWLVTVIEMAPISAVPPILKALGDLRSFEFSRKKVLTDGEKLHRQTEALRRLAPGVLALIDEEMGE